MPLPAASFINQLDPTQPTGTQKKYEGDDWFRLLQFVLQTQFPNLGAQAVLPTALQLNSITLAIRVQSPEIPPLFPLIAARANRLMVFDASGNFDTSRSLTQFDADVANTNTARNQAVTSAGNAATSESNAATSASNASASATLSMQWATNLTAVPGGGGLFGSRYYAQQAATSAINAATSEGNAGTSATNAANSAAQAGNTLNGTSATSLLIGTGSRSLTTQTNKAWAPGQVINLARTSAPTTQKMTGTVTAYDPASGAMTVLVGQSLGTGTFNDWTLSVSGSPGASSLTLPVQAISTSQTGVANVFYTLTAAAITLTMPAAPQDGDFFAFSNRSGGSPSIDPNGKKIKGDPTVMTLDNVAAAALLKYDAANGDWVEAFQGFTVSSISTNAILLQPNTWTAAQTFNDFTQMGELGTAVKTKVISGTTAAAQGGSVTVAHGLDRTKILSISAVVQAPNDAMPAEFSAVAGFQYSCFCSASNVQVNNSTANSTNILSRPFTVLITYKA